MELNNEEIQAGNRAIAEFLGYGKCQRCDDCGGYQYGALVYRPDQMRYHSSWDWLMPVVEKIESMGYFNEIEYEAKRNVMNIYEDNEKGYAKVASAMHTNKLTAVWQTCVAFINWQKTINQ